MTLGPLWNGKGSHSEAPSIGRDIIALRGQTGRFSQYVLEFECAAFLIDASST
jgi:hypothetical protein